MSEEEITWASNTGGDPRERCTPVHFEHAIYYAFLSVYHHARALAQRKRILDAGCGVGFGTHYLAINGATQVWGIDNAPEAIEYAIEHYQADNLRYAIADCIALPMLDGSFHLVFCSNLIEHVAAYTELIREVVRVLVPGGVFFVATPPVASRGESPHPHHVTNFPPQEWEEILAQHFSSLQLFKLHTNYDNWFKESLDTWEKGALHLSQALPRRVKSFVYRRILNPCNVRENDFLLTRADPENLAEADVVSVVMICWK